MNREQGYYWVKDAVGTWRIAEWDGNVFSFNGAGYSASLFQEINENRIAEPGENTRKENVTISDNTKTTRQFFGQIVNSKGIPEDVWVELPEGVSIRQFMSMIQNSPAQTPEQQALEFINRLKAK